MAQEQEAVNGNIIQTSLANIMVMINNKLP
jgi:hypothetical protein